MLVNPSKIENLIFGVNIKVQLAHRGQEFILRSCSQLGNMSRRQVAIFGFAKWTKSMHICISGVRRVLPRILFEFKTLNWKIQGNSEGTS